MSVVIGIIAIVALAIVAFLMWRAYQLLIQMEEKIGQLSHQQDQMSNEQVNLGNWLQRKWSSKSNQGIGQDNFKGLVKKLVEDVAYLTKLVEELKAGCARESELAGGTVKVRAPEASSVFYVGVIKGDYGGSKCFSDSFSAAVERARFKVIKRDGELLFEPIDLNFLQTNDLQGAVEFTPDSALPNEAQKFKTVEPGKLTHIIGNDGNDYWDIKEPVKVRLIY